MTNKWAKHIFPLSTNTHNIPVHPIYFMNRTYMLRQLLHIVHGREHDMQGDAYVK